MWPANSPSLKPIENLLSILGVKIKEQSKPTWNFQRLERILNKAWKKISRETLEIQFFSVKSVKHAKGHILAK